MQEEIVSQKLKISRSRQLKISWKKISTKECFKFGAIKSEILEIVSQKSKIFQRVHGTCPKARLSLNAISRD